MLDSWHLRLAIINEDNLNSAMDMPCNEMEILGFISKQIADVPACRVIPEDIICKAVSQFGNKSFSEQDLKCFYNYALMVPPTLVRNLCQLHFSMVPAAKLRCPPKVFNSIAGIKDGGLHPYCRVALIIEKYLGSNAGLTASTQGQSFVSMCANVKREALEEWAKKPEMLKTAESFLKAVLRHYKVDVKSALMSPLLGTRAKLYFRIGRLLQAWPKHQVTVYVGGLPQC